MYGNKVLIFGASGIVGRALIRSITAKRGPNTVIACLNSTPLPPSLHNQVITEVGIDVTNSQSLETIVKKYSSEIDAVWNLAAPLSVSTANDPDTAYKITVGGMQNLLAAIKKHGHPEVKVLFSDSIASFGPSAPRENAPANWVVNHPDEDPGTDYGRQKKEIRGLLKEFQGDTRWAILPGVLHPGTVWRGGTSEYALQALSSAVENRQYVCPLALDETLPMIWVEDLARGLVALMDARRAELKEPEAGYALAGFSFSPGELFIELTRLYPNFGYVINESVAGQFAKLWPNSLSRKEAKRDLDFEASITSLPEVIKAIRNAQQKVEKE